MIAQKQADDPDHALCSDCAKDTYLKQYIQDNGTPIRCSGCEEENFPAVPVEKRAEFIEPRLREYFEPGTSHF